MKIKLLTAVIFCGASGFSNAANYVISNVNDGLTDTLYADSDNELLSDGVVTLGVFPTSFDVESNLDNISILVDNFTQIFASGAIGGLAPSLGEGSFPGYAEHNPVDSAPLLTGNSLIGRTLYLFAGDGTTLAASDNVALLNMGLLQNEDGGELDYVANPQARVIDPTPSNDPLFGVLIGNLDTKTGNFGGQGSSTFTTLQLVPEPSTTLLAAVTALGLLRRRRN
jgi:hypothetical protein